MIVLFVGSLASGGISGFTVARSFWESSAALSSTAERLLDFRTGSGYGRLVQARVGTGIAMANPMLGVGPGNWAVEYPRFAAADDPSVFAPAVQPTDRIAQSDWIGFAVEHGLLATAAVLIGIISALAVAMCTAWRAHRQEYGRLSTSRFVLNLALCVFLFALLMVGLSDPILHNASTGVWLAVAVGCHLSLVRSVHRWSNRDAPERAHNLTLGPRKRVVAVAAAATVSLAALALACLALMRFLSFKQLDRAVDIAGIERARRLDPGNLSAHARTAYYWIELGRCDLAEPSIGAIASLMPYAPSTAAVTRRCTWIDSAQTTPSRKSH